MKITRNVSHKMRYALSRFLNYTLSQCDDIFGNKTMSHTRRNVCIFLPCTTAQKNTNGATNLVIALINNLLFSNTWISWIRIAYIRYNVSRSCTWTTAATLSRRLHFTLGIKYLNQTSTPYWDRTWTHSIMSSSRNRCASMFLKWNNRRPWIRK